MRVWSIVVVVVLAVAVLAGSMAGQAQSSRRLNPMIALHEKGLPVFGVTHPAITAGGRVAGPAAVAATDGGTPPPQPVLTDVARETMAYKLSDFEYDSYSPANAEKFREYMAAMLAAGGSMK